MSRKLLEVKSVVKIFHIGGRFLGTKLKAVNNVSFDIDSEKSEILTFAGETGSGKTTLARMILGLEQPTSGEITYKGKNVAIQKREELQEYMKEVQPYFQNPFETFILRKVDSLSFRNQRKLQFCKLRRKSEISEEALEIGGLTLNEVQGRYPMKMSGVQLQRNMGARALINKDSLLKLMSPFLWLMASFANVYSHLSVTEEEYNVLVLYINHDLATAYYIK